MLLDSNIVIYGVTKEFNKMLSSYLHDRDSSISGITKLEVLGFHSLLQEDKSQFEKLFSQLNILAVQESTIDKAINLRQQKSMSLGDALIAATALRYDLPLVTRNTGDFEWITELQLINPFTD